MSSAHDRAHLSIERLWYFAQQLEFPKLEGEELGHLWTCEHCTALLWLCHQSESVDHVIRRIAEG